MTLFQQTSPGRFPFLWRQRFRHILASVLVLSGVGIATLLLASARRQAKAEDPTAGLHAQKDWKADDGNPSLRLGDHLRLATWNDPSVLKVGSHYTMYLTTSLKIPGQPPVQPFRAVSEDGLKWKLEPDTPLLAPGSRPEDFDFQSIETPSVVFFGGQYHLYYTGVKSGLSGPMSLGHATSPDGTTWSKDPKNPILRPSGNLKEFNGFQVAEPGAVVYKNKIYLYFSAIGLRPNGPPPAKRVIALATSSDGSAFSAPKAVLEQNERYPPRLGFDGYSTPAAAVEGGRVHLFYDVGYFDDHVEAKWTQVALHHAVSENGESNWVQDADPILTRRSFAWASMEVRAPSPLFDGKVLKLWFAGNTPPADFLAEVRSTGKTGKFGIGSITTNRSRYDRPPK